MSSLARNPMIPTIDLTLCDSPQSLATAVEESISSSGFFFLKNHNLDSTALFRLAASLLHHVSLSKLGSYQIDSTNKGFDRAEVLDPLGNPEGDSKLAFNIGYISSTTPPVATQPLPLLLANHAAFLAEFQQKSFDLSQRLLTAFALVLSLDQDYFASKHTHDDQTASILRLLNYPAIPAGTTVSPNRAGAHSDYGNLTLLHVQGSGGAGLQILPSSSNTDIVDNAWVDVPVVEGAVLVNIGDALELWSGARFKSTLHRVRLPDITPPEGIPERFSIAFFNHPRGEALLTPVVSSSVTPHDFERMKRKGVLPGEIVTADQHLQARLNATYSHRS